MYIPATVARHDAPVHDAPVAEPDPSGAIENLVNAARSPSSSPEASKPSAAKSIEAPGTAAAPAGLNDRLTGQATPGGPSGDSSTTWWLGPVGDENLTGRVDRHPRRVAQP